MSDGLQDLVARMLSAKVPPEIAAFAEMLGRGADAAAVLFYGSVLRTGDRGGMLDFYVLTRAPHRRGIRRAVERRLWPEISFRERRENDIVLRAKVATMPLAVFASAAAGERTDTTIWTRFVQPSALAWVASEADRAALVDAARSAVITAARFAAIVGPESGPAGAYWGALFAETYRAEFRVEKPGRAAEIVGHDPAHYAALLPLAWTAAGVPFRIEGEALRPSIPAAERRRLRALWRRRRRWGRPLNVARLAKAAFTVEGAARYAAWKIERHTGENIALTPWQERHPILAAPGLAWRLRRRRRQADTRSA